MGGDGSPAREAPERDSAVRAHAINGTQGLVLAFFLLAWVALAAILAFSGSVREMMLSRAGSATSMALAIMAGLSIFLILLGVGVVRQWRWLFWLVLLAFATGVVRPPLAILQLSGRMSSEGPDWYVALQGLSGLVQAALACVMFIGYRRAGTWGACWGTR